MTKITAMSTTETRVREILDEMSFGCEDEPSSAKLCDLGMDSLDKIEFIMSLEEAFDLEIGDDEADAMETIQQVVAYVERRASH